MKTRINEHYLNYPWMYILVPSERLKQLYPVLKIEMNQGIISIVTKLSYSHVIPHFVEYLQSKIPDSFKELIEPNDLQIIDNYPIDIELSRIDNEE